MIDTGKMIKAVRSEKHLSQTDLARMLNVTKATISHYEKGTRMPNLHMLEAIADVTNTPITFFISNDELKKAYEIEYSKPEYSDVKEKSELFSDDELHLLILYRALTPEARRIAITTMESFAGNPAMQKEALALGKSAM